MTKRELFEECSGNVPLDVMNVSGSASDNAADTVGFGNRFDASGNFTDEFINNWYSSVQSLLCTDDTCTETARKWFELRGVKY